jgi:uncharacterized protein YkwD
MSAVRSALARRCRLQVEELETRQLLSGTAPTAVEQLFLEELNDARANPAAYGQSIGLDLSNVAPSPPLAFDPLLTEAARLHSMDMAARNYFAHNTPEGVDPGGQIAAVGYAWTSWGQSIAAGSLYPGPAEALAGLIIDNGVPDLGHRRHLLAIDPSFRSQTQVGIGILQNSAGYYDNYYTIDTASNADGRPFLTGVVYNDANGNGHYDPGEGLGGVTVTVAGVGAVTTWDSGGYNLRVAPGGTYTVTASGGGLPAPVTEVAAIGADNVRLNFTPRNDAAVQKLYQAILGRAPGAGELSYFGGVLQHYGAGLVVSILEHSTEGRAQLVRGWYQQYLGRPTNPGEEMGLANLLVAGWTENQALGVLLSSQEYYNRASSLGSGASADARFLDGLYRDLLGRGVDAGGSAFWQSQLPRLGRFTLASALLGSDEFAARQVRSFYTTILHRPAAPSDQEVSVVVGLHLDLTTVRSIFYASGEFLNG